jgi:hypothetical protein
MLEFISFFKVQSLQIKRLMRFKIKILFGQKETVYGKNTRCWKRCPRYRFNR